MKEIIDNNLSVKGSIKGTVTASNGRTTLKGISVAAYIFDLKHSRWDKIDEVTTDNNGNYTISNLADGYYQVLFEDNSGKYSGIYYYHKSDFQIADNVLIENGQTKSDINVSLFLSGSIKGKVTESDGTTPCEYINVECRDIDKSYNTYRRATDEHGNYKFNTLSQGKYRIEFRDMLQGYAPLFYNNQTDKESADIIEVTAGDTVSGIDASLVMGGEIHGKVTLPDEKTPVKDADITVYRQNNSNEELERHYDKYAAKETTNSKGRYKIIGLASGTYMVKCEIDRFKRERCHEKYASEYWLYDIDVSAGNVAAGINFSLSLGGNIQGRVLGPDGITPLKGIKVKRYDEDGIIELIGEPKTYTDKKGIYNLCDLAPKKYKIVFVDEKGKYLKKVDTNIITVKPEETYINSDICLSLAGHIQGRVTRAGSATPLKNITVSVCKDDSKDDRSCRWLGCFLQNYLKAKTDINGNYEIGGLDSGEYWIEFKDESETYLPQFYNNQFSLEYADSVQVTAGNTATGIDITLKAYKRR